MTATTTIPASAIVNVVPSVIGAGGNALALNTVVLTTNGQMTTGQVLQFASAAAVATFFTGASDEAKFADIYFAGFEGATQVPGNLIFAFYATSITATMAGVVSQTTDWAMFTSIYDPDSGTPHVPTVKTAWAAWANSQNNRYGYVAWDTDTYPTTTLPATASLGYVVNVTNSDTGTICISGPDYTIAAFVCGAIAAIDFNATNGRITLAFKAQAGLVATATTATVASNLLGNYYNFYGSYATANQGFKFFNNGSISGMYKWIDSFVNQIWLNNAFQLALMELLTSAKSVPYDNLGYGLIRAALTDPINAGLNYGAFAPGVPLSALQTAEVNAAAGLQISQTLQSQGWYLQILPATPTNRAARATPPINFWYTDAGSIQVISMASVEVQ